MKGKVITLKNNKKYLILDNITYNKVKYLYLSSLDSKNLKICFAKAIKEKGSNFIEEIEDEKLIKELSAYYITHYTDKDN